MPSDFLYPGTIDLYVCPRASSNFYFLGTCLSSPHVSVSLVYENTLKDANSPAPNNKILCGEVHVISALINRVNYRTFNRIKDVGNSLGIGSNLVRTYTPGNMVIGAYDFQLFLNYQMPSSPTPVPPPDAAQTGRLYFSSALLNYEEDTPNRVQELALVFECNALNVNGAYNLYSENPSDFPPVTFE